MTQPIRRIRLPGSEFSEVVCILDRSGSMANIKNDAIGGFNSFLKDQLKSENNINLTLVQFDTEYEMVHENLPIEEVPKLSEATFQPRGCTALLDALGKTIEDTIARIEASSRKPNAVIFTIITDGQENSSHNFNLSQIKELIEGQQEAGWMFIFLAANQDAFREAAGMGIRNADSVTYNVGETRSAMMSMSSGIASRADSARLGESNVTFDSMSDVYDRTVNDGQSESTDDAASSEE